jgi:hypothetical protein
MGVTHLATRDVSHSTVMMLVKARKTIFLPAGQVGPDAQGVTRTAG